MCGWFGVLAAFTPSKAWWGRSALSGVTGEPARGNGDKRKGDLIRVWGRRFCFLTPPLPQPVPANPALVLSQRGSLLLKDLLTWFRWSFDLGFGLRLDLGLDLLLPSSRLRCGPGVWPSRAQVTSLLPRVFSLPLFNPH